MTAWLLEAEGRAEEPGEDEGGGSLMLRPSSLTFSGVEANAGDGVLSDFPPPLVLEWMLPSDWWNPRRSRPDLLPWLFVDDTVEAIEKDRDLGMVRDIVVGEDGEGELLLEPWGELPGVLSREWRKLELRVRTGSDSRVGSPVALVVVVHVDVDILRIKLGGKLLRSLCKTHSKHMVMSFVDSFFT